VTGAGRPGQQRAREKMGFATNFSLARFRYESMSVEARPGSGARRGVRHGPPEPRDVARVEAAGKKGALVRVARIGLVAAMVYGLTLFSSMPRCAHDRRPDCVTDAAQSPLARRHCEFPPLRATPALLRASRLPKIAAGSAFSPRLIWPRSPRRCAVVSCGGSPYSDS
jgi:hypothetical protein